MGLREITTVGLLILLPGCDLIERAAQILDKKEPVSEVESAPSPLQPAPAKTAAPSPSSAPSEAPGTSVAPMSFAKLAARANPGVVFVQTVQSRRQGFRRVLAGGSGSGFIFDRAGRILTNHHVVSGAHAIQVELQDGRAFVAEVVGADPLTDLAVLQVPQGDLPALSFGDSDAIQVGDWVVAIGNPFGLEHTVSAGIISAKERTGRDVQLGDRDAYFSFLQTDASINPGNSGGPLLDLEGRVVGINTAINQKANNIGFAIPIEMIKELLPRLLKDGRIRRAAIGVIVDDVSRETVLELGLSDRKGAFIAKVVRGGPADQGGIQPGDVLVEFDGHAIGTPEQLRWRASLAPIGKETSFAVIREGKRKNLSLKPVFLRPR